MPKPVPLEIAEIPAARKAHGIYGILRRDTSSPSGLLMDV